MLHVKAKHAIGGMAAAFLPLVTSLVAIYKSSIILVGVSIIAMYLIIGLIPFTRGYESRWIFLLSSLASIPINIRLVTLVMGNSLIEQNIAILYVMRCIMIYIVVFCIEEIILGFFARLIWKNQRSFSST